jgi:hypothetical protein
LIGDVASRELSAYGVKATVAHSVVDISYKGSTVELRDFDFDAKTGTIDAKVSLDGFSSREVALVKLGADGAITLSKTAADIIDMLAGRDIVSDHTVLDLGELLWGWPIGIVSPPIMHPLPIFEPGPVVVSPPIMQPLGLADGGRLSRQSRSADDVSAGAGAGAAERSLGNTGIVSSSANGFSSVLRDNGHMTTIAPFARVFGAAPPAFDHTKTIAHFDKTYDLSRAKRNYLSLQVEATHIVDTAKSAGLGIDAISTRGEARLGSADFALIDNPLSTLAVLGLSVEATGVHSDSNASFVFGPDEGSLTGDASFRSLTISGDLVHGKTLKFSGDAKANTVLYSSSTVTITLDRQTLLLPPAGASAAIGPSITTDAIDIRFNGAKFFGHTITGDFVIGQSSAGYELMRA